MAPATPTDEAEDEGGRRVSAAEVDALLAAEREQLDVRAEMAAERLKMSIVRLQTKRELGGLLLLLAGLVVAWFGARLMLAEREYLVHTLWWDGGTGETVTGYALGRPAQDDERVTIRTAIVAVELPPIHWVQALVGSAYLPHAGAGFLLLAVRELGHVLTYAHWRGDGTRADDWLRAPMDAAIDCADDEVAGNVDWHVAMRRWSRKRRRGTGAPVADSRNLAGVIDYAPAPGSDAEFANLWARVYRFSTTADMARSHAVHEFLCQPGRAGTALYALFSGGLVGYAQEAGLASDATAASLFERAFGQRGVAYREPKPCTTAKLKGAFDMFSLGTGVLGMMGGFVPQLGAPMLAAGALGSAGLAYHTYSTTSC